MRKEIGFFKMLAEEVEHQGLSWEEVFPEAHKEISKEYPKAGVGNIPIIIKLWEQKNPQLKEETLKKVFELMNQSQFENKVRIVPEDELPLLKKALKEESPEGLGTLLSDFFKEELNDWAEIVPEILLNFKEGEYLLPLEQECLFKIEELLSAEEEEEQEEEGEEQEEEDDTKVVNLRKATPEEILKSQSTDPVRGLSEEKMKALVKEAITELFEELWNSSKNS